MVNESRKSKVEKFLRIVGHDPVYSCECKATVHHLDEDVLIISYQGSGPDDVYVGLCIVSDTRFEYSHTQFMEVMSTVNVFHETPMDNPWEESVAEFDAQSAEIIREFIGAM
jgi:hypothetical protein